MCPTRRSSDLEDRKRLESFILNGHETLKLIEQSPLPAVCAVQGLCLAGGLELVLSCDVAFAARSAKFGDQHSRYGLVPGWGGSQRSEEHTSELQSLMRISYAVFCFKKT